jgi:hypothetical protein
VSNAAAWGMIDAEPIFFPLVVDEFNSAMLLFSVPAPEARSLLPGNAFELVEPEPDSAQLVLAACDFRRNPWGDHDEINVGFLVRPQGAPVEANGVLMHRTFVNQRFTHEAGRRALTVPRAQDQIDVRYAADTVTFDLAVDGRPALSLRVPRLAPDGDPKRRRHLVYSYVNNVARRVCLDIDMPQGTVDPAAVNIRIDAGPMAAELRHLGLPHPPDFCTWGEGLSSRLFAPEPI